MRLGKALEVYFLLSAKGRMLEESECRVVGCVARRTHHTTLALSQRVAVSPSVCYRFGVVNPCSTVLRALLGHFFTLVVVAVGAPIHDGGQGRSCVCQTRALCAPFWSTLPWSCLHYSRPLTLLLRIGLLRQADSLSPGRGEVMRFACCPRGGLTYLKRLCRAGLGFQLPCLRGSTFSSNVGPL